MPPKQQATQQTSNIMQQTTNNKDREISLDEIARHNKRGDAWVVVHQRVLDVSEFAKTHPGGDIILLAAGLDATIMFESYHLKRVSDKILDKLQIGTLAKLQSDIKNAADQEALVAGTYYNWDGKFYSTLQERVLAKLESLGRSRRGGLLPKAILILTSFFTFYYLTFLHPFANDQMWMVAICAIIYGASAAQIGLGIQHDGNHGAFSTTPWVNKLAGMGMDLIGASAICWEYQHVIGHHQYTNLSTPTDRVLSMRSDEEVKGKVDSTALKFDQENDPDVFSSFPLIRMHPYDERSWYHRFQHIYGPIFFALFTLSKVLLSDIKFFTQQRMSHISMESRLSSKSEQFRFIAFKLLNFAATMIVPTMLHGWKRTAMAMFISHCVAGEYLALCFIVNHIGELCEFYTGGKPVGVENSDENVDESAAKEKEIHPRDWAYCQAKATTNWAVGSFFWNHFSGGLNHQLEHHLFPGVAHINYPYIASTVRDTCKEFNVPYIETKTFFGACYHCFNYLRILGTQDVVSTPARQKID